MTDEFARQASMEQDLGIESALFAAPVREIIELGKSQIGFMNMFAIPLFQGVTDVMPAMAFSVDELHQNKSAWEDKINDEQARIRKDSDISALTDGMFSPRSMSLATPSDASHQRKGDDLRLAALMNSKFSPTNGVLSEEPHSQSSPDVTTGSDELAVSAPDETRSKPALQLSYATASAPGLLDKPSEAAEYFPNGEVHVNGLDLKPSLVTDAVIAPVPDEEKPQSGDKQRSSDGTEASGSATGDWASQATSATTSKMPISPSTQGTSIMSQESSEKGLTPTGGSPLASKSGQASRATTNASDESHSDGKGAMVMEKVRNLKKKPSRFRMQGLNVFSWKRSKSASPPVPDLPRDDEPTLNNC